MIPLIFAGIAAVAGFTGAWQIQSMRHDRAVSEIRATQAQELATAIGEAHAKTLALQAAKDASERKARIREATLARDLAANRAGLTGLSDAADSALRAANESHGACMANASTLRVVFGECSERRVSVAADAQGHLIDKQTLTESWPK